MHQKIKHDVQEEVPNPKTMKFKHLLVTAQKDLGGTTYSSQAQQQQQQQRKKQKCEVPEVCINGKVKASPEQQTIIQPPRAKSSVLQPTPVSPLAPLSTSVSPTLTKTSSPPPTFQPLTIPTLLQASLMKQQQQHPLLLQQQLQSSPLTANSTIFDLALNIPLTRLQMDLWERDSIYFGDLIARISLTERKFFWESVNLDGLVRITLGFDDVERMKLEGSTLTLSVTRSPVYSIRTLQLGQAIWTNLPTDVPIFGKSCTHVLHVNKVTNFLTLSHFITADPHLRKISVLTQER
jgi:hypothetical protein